MVSYSAPAKVILSGEHAVVYGKPALVCAIDRRVKLTVFEGGKKVKDENISQMAEKVKKFLDKKGDLKDKKFGFDIDSQVPIGRGLGSSAALSVASVACFLEFFSGKEYPEEMVNNLAYQIEKRFHQNPSGVDNTASCFGGLIYFRREFEFLKSIFKLPFKIAKKIERQLYLIDSGKPEESTGEMVKLVGTEYNKRPKKTKQILQEIESVTKRLVVSVVKEDEEFFKNSLLENQLLLEELEVVSKKTKKLLERLSKFGSGKITGAGGKRGGSGFLIFMVEKKKEFESFCQKNKISYFRFKPTYQGLKKEKQ